MEDHGKNTSGTIKLHGAKAKEKTNTETNTDTKTALIFAAGELFAKQGFDGVSTRMIAEKAGVNLGAIHYHFGSKENLYVDTFRIIAAEGKGLRFSEILENRQELQETPEGQGEIIREMVFSLFQDLLGSSRADWKKRLLIQELFNPSPVMPALVTTVLKPDNENLAAFYRKICPGKSLHEAHAWADLLYAQAFFYLMSREPLEMLRGKEQMGAEFLRTVEITTARSMILLAGLPLPEDLVLDETEKNTVKRVKPPESTAGTESMKNTERKE